MFKRLLLVIFLAGLFSAAWGQDFGLDIGCCSDPLTQSASVNVLDGGVHDYFNSTLDPITELDFAITVGAGRAPDAASLTALLNGYTCLAFEFFGSCAKSYDNTTGQLFLDFAGVNPANLDGDEGFGSTDPETKASEGSSFTGPEGLPTLASMAYLLTPDLDPTCTGRGHFEISFNTFLPGNEFNGATCTSDCAPGAVASGTWNAGATASIVEINGHAVPEPPATIFLAISLFCSGLLARRRARRTRG